MAWETTPSEGAARKIREQLVVGGRPIATYLAEKARELFTEEEDVNVTDLIFLNLEERLCALEAGRP